MTLSIPPFSNPTSRTQFNNTVLMLSNYFQQNEGLSKSDADIKAAQIISFKQQGLSNAEIETALNQHAATISAIATKQKNQAAAALASQKTTLDQIKAAQAAATPKASLIAHNAAAISNNLTADQRRALVFAEQKSAEPMVADPRNPRGALITQSQYNQIIANEQSASNSSGITFATPNISKVVAINGVPVVDATKPSTASTPSTTDPTKTLSVKNTSNPQSNDILSQVNSVVQAAISDAQKTGKDLNTTITTALQNAGLAATQEATNILQTLGIVPKAPATKKVTQVIVFRQINSNIWAVELDYSDGTKENHSLSTANVDSYINQGATLNDASGLYKKPVGSPSSTSSTQQQAPDYLKQFIDFLGSIFTPATKSTSDAAAATEKAAADALAAAQKQATDLIANAEVTIVGFLSKLNPATTTTDPTKGNPPTDTTPPDTTPQTPTPQTTPEPQPQNPLPANTATLKDKVIAFAKKYATPIIGITLAAGGIAIISVVTSNQRKKEIEALR